MENKIDNLFSTNDCATATSLLVDELKNDLDYLELSKYIHTSKYLRPRKYEKITVIAIIIRTMEANGGAGPQHVIDLHLKLLLDKGYQVVLITEGEISKDVDLPPEVETEVIPYDLPLNSNNYHARATSLIDIIKKHNVDIVHYHQYRINTPIFDVISIKSQRIPVLMFYHISPTLPFSKQYGNYTRRLATLKSADRLAVLSKCDEVFWRTMGIHAEYIPNPIDLSMMTEKNLNDRGNYILWIGRFDDLKRPFDAIYIVKQIKNRIPNIKMKMIGANFDDDPTSTTSRVEKTIKDENLSDNIELVAFTKNVRPYYQNASIHLNTSITEAFPMTICEGKLYGLPLVSYDIAGIEPLKDKGAFACIQPGDVLGAANAIINILEDDNRYEQLSKCAHSSIRPFIDYDIIGRLEELMELSFQEFPSTNENSDIKATFESILLNYDFGIMESRRQTKAIKQTNNFLTKKNNALKQDIKKYKNSLRRVKSSNSFKLGVGLTYPIRMIKKKFW